MNTNQCHRCGSSLDNAEVVPQSNYALVFCPRCGEVNERPEQDAEEVTP